MVFTISSWGIKVENFIWHWNQGSITVFTRDRQRAEEAMRNGIEVIGEKITSKIIRY